jgi:hypothetical protein
MLCGGGIKPGYVHGASDRIGSLPIERPVSPGDIVSTIYWLLGIDHERLLYDALNRPHAVVPRGGVVDDLIT